MHSKLKARCLMGIPRIGEMRPYEPYQLFLYQDSLCVGDAERYHKGPPGCVVKPVKEVETAQQQAKELCTKTVAVSMSDAAHKILLETHRTSESTDRNEAGYTLSWNRRLIRQTRQESISSEECSRKQRREASSPLQHVAARCLGQNVKARQVSVSMSRRRFSQEGSSRMNRRVSTPQVYSGAESKVFSQSVITRKATGQETSSFIQKRTAYVSNASGALGLLERNKEVVRK